MELRILKVPFSYLDLTLDFRGGSYTTDIFHHNWGTDGVPRRGFIHEHHSHFPIYRTTTLGPLNNGTTRE